MAAGPFMAAHNIAQRGEPNNPAESRFFPGPRPHEPIGGFPDGRVETLGRGAGGGACEGRGGGGAA